MTQNVMSSKERIIYLDVVRVLACAMVVLMHSPKPGVVTDSLQLSTISFLCAPCIGLFFMVSGALLLPSDFAYPIFIKKRFGKILFPTLFWTVVYVLLNMIDGVIPPQTLPKVILSIPLSAQGDGVLWFMYTLAGLYLITPILSPWLSKASEKDILIVLSLWGVTLFFPLLRQIVSIDSDTSGILYYFSGFCGYYLLGYYIHRYNPKVGWPGLLALLLIPILSAVFCKLYGIEVEFYSVFWYLGIFVVMMAAALFMILSRVPWKSTPFANIVSNVSNCSFGIYLIHIAIMRHFLWRFSFIDALPGLLHIVVTFILTFFLSWAIVYVISKLPFGKYLVGFSSR